MFRRLVRILMQKYPMVYGLRQHWGMVPALLAGRGGGQRSWSQHGEDQRLRQELEGLLETGYFVDIGANHPAELSNTYRLYCLGMRGICIEPNETLCRMHRRYRAGDTTLCSAVGTEDGLLTMYEMYPHTFSTFSRESRDAYMKAGMPCLRETLVPIFRLSTILRCYTPPGRSQFALLSVDTEGFDEIVLRSNDWERYRPLLIVAEGNDSSTASGIQGFLESVGYAALASYGCNVIYRRCA